MGYGKSPSRFSDPRRRIAANRFGVLYLGETLKVCFLEAVLRDRRDGADGSLLLGEDELHDRDYATIEIASPLNMVDLRGDGAIRLGVPTDVARASRQALARQWSLAWHEHPSGPDGITYPSRLNGQTNLAIFHRAVPKLRAVGVQPLFGAAGLATVLDDLMVELAP
ncbi:RES family NAD+ phosphorylase [Bradyrhizobium yuanmingense]|uniref:RES family NAD+ phosphorylase n=1 Tax=Bradyrhizobium yuanmingense TaxID=108015 RepID=UPI00114D2DD2|nr:RES family NAD+ phosphorylase [Bradyrhizobium yuanmingense]